MGSAHPVKRVICATALGSGSSKSQYAFIYFPWRTSFSHGWGDNLARPKSGFNGEILHSTQHKKVSDHAVKKVIVVGACTAVDYYDQGNDTNMWQRSWTYIVSR